MRHYLRLIWRFFQASVQQEVAYRANFVIGLLHSLLNFASGVAGVAILFAQVETIQGWDFAATLAVLGVYLTVSALRNLFVSPSLDALVGLSGDVWSGRLDYTLLRPVSVQFLATFRQWRLFALVDLALGVGVLVAAMTQLGPGLSLEGVSGFLVMLASGMAILYAVLLAFTGLVFWSPGFLFTWVFDGVFQMARYPVGLYPGWLRLILTWVIPIGLITTVPAQALSEDLPPETLVGSLVFAVLFLVGASALFRVGLRRYASASS